MKFDIVDACWSTDGLFFVLDAKANVYMVGIYIILKLTTGESVSYYSNSCFQQCGIMNDLKLMQILYTNLIPHSFDDYPASFIWFDQGILLSISQKDVKVSNY